MSEQTIRRTVLFSLFLAVILSAGCSKKETDVPSSIPDQSLENFKVDEYKEGKKIWTLNGEKADASESDKSVLLTNFKVDFFNEARKVTSILTAKKGKFDIMKKDFFTEGATNVTTSDGETLLCSDLKYLSSRKHLFSDSKVTITRKNSILTGEGLEATPDLSVVIIKKNKVILNKKDLKAKQ